MTLWNVAVLALILGALGGVVRYRVQADRFATVDRTLAERAHEAGRRLAPDSPAGGRNTSQSRLLAPMTSAAEGSFVGSTRPGALPPLQPRILPRDRAGREHWDKPWDRHAYARSLAGRTVYSTVWDGGTPTRILSIPIERRGRVEEVIQLAYPLDGVLAEIDALTSTLLALVPFGLLAAGLGGAFLTGRALRPVREIAGTAARLGASDLSERLRVSGRDEFSELSTSINAMLARLEEAFDRQRRFTADASHELRTPLSIIKANTSLALEHPWTEERYREFLAAIDTAAGRQGRIVEELLFLARADAGALARDVGPVCLIEALEEAAEAGALWAIAAGAQRAPPRIRLEAIDPALVVSGSGSELTRLFTNLLENAVRHLPHLGERFYRVDAARSAGTGGTGLAICRSITEAHGGRMTIESKAGEGTAVRIRLLLCPRLVRVSYAESRKNSATSR
jgi:signal transduction histidine kinase